MAVTKEWRFSYIAEKVAEGAATKLKIVMEKIAWWEIQKAELLKTAAGSIVVEESLASNYTSAGRGPQVTVDYGLQTKLSECHNRLVALNLLRKQYDAWVQVLTANKTQTLQLDHEDWMFFFGVESGVPNEDQK